MKIIDEMFNAYAVSHAIDIRIEELKKLLLLDDEDPRYTKIDIAGDIENLVKLRDLDKGTKDGWFSKIDLSSIFGNVVGLISVAMILEYEKTDIIATKGLSIATKMLH